MSGSESPESIFIRGVSSHNGMTTVLIGVVALVLGTLGISLLPELFFLAAILIVVVGIIALVMGYFKIREPKYSLEISKQEVVYHHRLGKWSIDWNNIQRIDVPRVRMGLEHIDLEMVGFRLKDPEAFLPNISLRLITHLLMEQRPLITQIERSSCGTGKCYGDDMMEDAKYKTKSGEIITGVIAMYANRMRKLQEGLGFDVFVSVNELDRGAHEFVNLIRQCHDSVKQDEIAKQTQIAQGHN
jgi:hypothetical protein